MMNSQINLLVIDDDEINIFITKKIIEKTMFDVNMVSKGNGKLAIEYISSIADNKIEFPQLILIDINMPVLNGWDFIEAYEKLNITPEVEIYILSSSVYENDIEKAKTYKSVKGFISKPLSLERLSELLTIVRMKDY